MKKNIFVEIISILLIAIFLFSSISKVIHLKDLITVLNEFPLLSNMPHVSAWLLFIIELAVALLLMFLPSGLIGIKVMIVYLTAASFYIGWVLLFTGKNICTCAAFFKILSWPQHIIINLVLIMLGTGVLIFSDRQKPIVKNQQRKQFPI